MHLWEREVARDVEGSGRGFTKEFLEFSRKMICVKRGSSFDINILQFITP